MGDFQRASWLMELHDALSQRRARGLLRALPRPLAGKDFYSNDYLGLAQSTAIYEQTRAHAQGFKLNGATGSRLLSGNSPAAEALEKALARFFCAERALLFNTGYMANLAVLSAVPARHDAIFYDAAVHACIKDGMRLSHAPHYPFRHQDMDDLEQKLKRSTARRCFVVAEALYSMEGTFCPLEALITLCEKYDAVLILDEAHSTGTEGKGPGLAVARGHAEAVGIRIHTFGKAFGVQGACVVGAAALIEYLVNVARPFIYTTAPSPHTVATLTAVLQHLDIHPELVQALQDRIHTFLSHSHLLPETLCSRNPSPIQNILMPGNKACQRLADQLHAQGYALQAIRAPTVPAGTERLRICLHTFNTPQDIVGLLKTLQDLCL